MLTLWLALALQQSFPTRLIELEGQVRRVQLVDLDRDGRLDALVEKAHVLSWLAGNGAGGFGAPRTVNGSTGWKPLLFRELDGDAWLDALGTRSNPGALVFVSGDGAGGFGPRISLANGDFPTADVADLDGDGDLEIVAWERGARSLRTYQRVNGAWIAMGVTSVSNADVLALGAGDFDRDGAADVALSLVLTGPLPQPKLVVLHGDASGAFGDRWSLSFSPASRLESADLDGDGAPEIVATTAAELVAIHHQGQRQYAISSLAPVFQGASRIAEADSDGDLDLVVGTPEGSRLHLNDGHGRFPQRVNLLTHPSGGCDLADLDGDGAAELVGTAGQGRIAVTRSNGNGGWDDLHVGRSSASMPVAAGDVDGDGIEDLLLDMGSVLEIARGTAQGALVPAGQMPLSASNGAYASDLRDLDADGDLDVLLRQWTGTYEFLANDGTGQFAAAAALPMPIGLVLHWADFDGDGIDDALSPLGSMFTLYRGLAGGGFAPPVITLHPITLDFRALADVNGDGARDVVLTRSGVGFEIWRCTSSGTFVASASFAWSDATPQLAAADFDGDGLDDVAWIDIDAGLMRCARGSTTGTLSQPVDSPLLAPAAPQALPYVSELNGDGLPDLILHAGLTTGLEPEVRLSLGGGRFGRPAKFAAGAASRALVLLDVDGDGRRDFVTDNRYVSRPLVLLQR